MSRRSADAAGQKPAAIMRVADEYRVRIVDSAVKPHAEQIAEKRAGGDAAEMSEIRRQQSGSGNAPLLIALPISKKEDAVAADRATEGEAELPPLEERIGIGGVAVKSGIGRELVVAEEIEGRAVEIDCLRSA